MRILDLDLDFFLADYAEFMPENGDRLNDVLYAPWKAGDVRSFLENKCGLSSSRKIKGRLVTHHHEAFGFWRDLISQGILTQPFEVVHVDAHADLGGGWGDYTRLYVTRDLLHQALELRSQAPVDHKALNSGNYLTVAIACRWLSKLVYVYHPKRKDKNADFDDWLFRDSDMSSLTIELPKYPADWEPFPGVSPKVLEREPSVTFDLYDGNAFQDTGNFDFMVLAQSPAFTPASADLLIPVIGKYMTPI